jgi:hypothetical protein
VRDFDSSRCVGQLPAFSSVNKSLRRGRRAKQFVLLSNIHQKELLVHNDVHMSFSRNKTARDLWATQFQDLAAHSSKPSNVLEDHLKNLAHRGTAGSALSSNFVGRQQSS